MRGRSSNLITLSSSPSLIPPIEVFWANFYLIVWPLSLFFGLLPVYRGLPVHRKWPNPAHDTVPSLCYMIAKEFGSLKGLSFSPTSAQNCLPLKKTRQGKIITSRRKNRNVFNSINQKTEFENTGGGYKVQIVSVYSVQIVSLYKDSISKMKSRKKNLAWWFFQRFFLRKIGYV